MRESPFRRQRAVRDFICAETTQVVVSPASGMTASGYFPRPGESRNDIIEPLYSVSQCFSAKTAIWMIPTMMLTASMGMAGMGLPVFL